MADDETRLVFATSGLSRLSDSNRTLNAFRPTLFIPKTSSIAMFDMPKIFCRPTLLSAAALTFVFWTPSFFSPVIAQQDGATKARTLVFNWEVDPEIGTVWMEPVEVTLPRVDVAELRSSELTIRMQAMQKVARLDHADVLNREEVFKAALSQLQSDLSVVNNEQALLAATSAASSMAANQAEIEQVWELVKDRPRLHPAVERELLEWKSAVALPVWRSRLQSAAGSQSARLTAMEGLALVGEADDRKMVSDAVVSPATLPPVKLACAERLGETTTMGLEDVAEQLASSSEPLASSLAIQLIRNHSSEKAVALQEKILKDGSPIAQAAAYAAIANRDPAKARELAFELMKHPEVNLRMTAVNVLGAVEDLRAMKVQALALDDENLQIRELVRKNLTECAKNPAFRSTVNNVISHFLRGEAWEGNEQAIHLAAVLKQSERQEQIVAFLDHPQPRVAIRAAWALKELKLEAQTLDAVFQVAKRLSGVLENDKALSIEEQMQLAFLFEALGVHRYEAASGMLELYIPRFVMPNIPRVAAIYGLGHIWSGKPNSGLGNALAGRMLEGGSDPEENTVRYASTIAIGRMGDPSLKPRLDSLEELPPSALGKAKQWALQQLAN